MSRARPRALLAVAFVATTLAACQDSQAPDLESPTSSTAAGIGKVRSYNNLTKNHRTSGFHYQQEPPVGGDHHPMWANCGIYDKEIKPEPAVHSLEHGTVWITYKRSVPKAQVSALKAKARKRGDYMLMSIDNKQDAPIMLTAWGKQLKVATADDPSIDTFIQNYWKGPQTPEPGASCSGAYDPRTGSGAEAGDAA